MKCSGNIVDLYRRTIYGGTIHVNGGFIEEITDHQGPHERFILPGFVDSHVHIEASMLVPSEFARLAVVHGTVATVSDSHEIANVLGPDGIEFMIANGQSVPFKFYFSAPSCVPASSFDVSGGSITVSDIQRLLDRPQIRYLGEMMNVPAVLHNDADVLAKIAAARERGKPIDGHAPGLSGNDLKTYIGHGITTDHESVSLDEALEKIDGGMKIIIREGSAARDFSALAPLIRSRPDMCMLCTDDFHPDDLLRGHINRLVHRAVAEGGDVFDVLRCASLNPIHHYGLDVGLLRKGDPADFIVVANLHDFPVLETYVSGTLVAQRGTSFIPHRAVSAPNVFRARQCSPEDLSVPYPGGLLNVIDALDGEIVTGKTVVPPKLLNGTVVADPERDVLKLALLNRYHEGSPAVAFVRNFGLRDGAIASSVSHDSHNIIAVGTNDRDMAHAINTVIDAKGGLSAVHRGKTFLLPLPVAGIMSDRDGPSVVAESARLGHMVRKMGSSLHAPFMTLSFMALLVIPHLKIGDRGLFDADRFAYTELFSPEG